MSICRTAIIEDGMFMLNQWGAHHICKVCISNSGSCCRDCLHLRDGVGCQLRNTSCTAWLCGFHKFLFYSVGLLEEWNTFWEQVPGQDYREDFTPDHVDIKLSLPRQKQRMEHLGEALAIDLQNMERSHIAIGIILTLREKLDKNIDQLIHGENDQKKKTRLQRKIKVMTSEFTHFNSVLDSYRKLAESN